MLAPADAPPFHLGHRTALDGLRGVAVLAVMLYHSGILPGGWLGVDVFFTLSGFLITSLLLEEQARTGRIGLRDFYARRALRLLPALLLLVTACGAVTIAWGQDPARERLLDVAAVVLYVANWAIAMGRPLFVFGHAWSLAIEEQFYLVWPPLLLLLLRRVRHPGAITAVTAAAAAGAVAWRIALTGDKASMARVFVGLDTRADSVLVGCALAMLVAWTLAPGGRLDGRRLGWIGGAGAVGLALLLALAHFPADFWFHHASTSAAVATAAVIAAALGPRSTLARWLEASPLVAVGRISYGLYLWHYPIFFAFGVLLGSTARFDPANFQQHALAWAVTFAVCVASFRFVEQPALRLKARFASLPAPARV